MPADDHRAPDPQRDEAARLVDEVADRARRAAEDAPATEPRPELPRVTRRALDEARGHLDAASHSAGAGTEIPGDARLRQVKQAALIGMRPVTSYQVPFNREVLAALDGVLRVVEDLGSRTEGFDDGVDNHVRRLQAALATLDVQVADLDADTGDVADSVATLVDSVAALERLQATHGRALAELRARIDAAQRIAPPDHADDGAGARSDDADASAGHPADPALVRRLAAAARPPELAAWAERLLPVVEPAAALGPVLDLESAGGEWLATWLAAGLDATGADDDPEHRAALVHRGLDVADARPIDALAATPAGSVGAVTAATFADVVPLAVLSATVDAARDALAPGGALVLAVAAARGDRPDDVLWIDPRRRPVDPRLLAALALDRGFAEAEVVTLGDDDADDGPPRAHALVARTTGGA